jgi:hypothetical protein
MTCHILHILQDISAKLCRIMRCESIKLDTWIEHMFSANGICSIRVAWLKLKVLVG